MLLNYLEKKAEKKRRIDPELLKENDDVLIDKLRLKKKVII